MARVRGVIDLAYPLRPRAGSPEAGRRWARSHRHAAAVADEVGVAGVVWAFASSDLVPGVDQQREHHAAWPARSRCSRSPARARPDDGAEAPSEHPARWPRAARCQATAVAVTGLPAHAEPARRHPPPLLGGPESRARRSPGGRSALPARSIANARSITSMARKGCKPVGVGSANGDALGKLSTYMGVELAITSARCQARKSRKFILELQKGYFKTFGPLTGSEYRW